MQVTTLAELASELEHVDAWLGSLGFRKHDRLRDAMRIVQEAADAFVKARATGEPTKIGHLGNYQFGVGEAAELCDVWHAFRDIEPAAIRPILRRTVQGPARSRDETRETAAARNTMFELALAAEWKLLGGKVRVGEPDITLFCPETEFAIECKRPFAQHSIRANVRGAAAQLEGKLDRDESRVGVIAVSVSRVFDDGRRVLVSNAESDRARAEVENRVSDLYKAESDGWRTARFHPRIAAILFHARIMGASSDHPINRLRSTVISHVGKNPAAYDQLLAELERLYPENVTVEP